MEHRGAVGAEVNTGDGAGILTALPYEFLEKVAKADAGITLPARGKLRRRDSFPPPGCTKSGSSVRHKIAKLVQEYGQNLLGWRKVPVNNSNIGPTALASEPVMEQIFVSAAEGLDDEAFDRALFVIRKKATHALSGKDGLDSGHFFYIVSPVYPDYDPHKGMLTTRPGLHLLIRTWRILTLPLT
jgi:glutamate synthase (NADPH/NADH) large chain